MRYVGGRPAEVFVLLLVIALSAAIDARAQCNKDCRNARFYRNTTTVTQDYYWTDSTGKTADNNCQVPAIPASILLMWTPAGNGGACQKKTIPTTENRIRYNKQNCTDP